MKLTLLVALFAGAFIFTAASQDARYETVTVTAEPGTAATNCISIADYETGEIVHLDNTSGGVASLVTKNGISFQALPYYSPSYMGATIVRGPAMFCISASTNSFQVNGMMTVKITPVSYPVNQTLIVPPGTNQVQISLESSTNLVSWQTATNGAYGGTTNTAQFFRMHLTNLQP